MILPQLAVMPQEEMLGGGVRPTAAIQPADDAFAGFRKPPRQERPAKQPATQPMPPADPMNAPPANDAFAGFRKPPRQQPAKQPATQPMPQPQQGFDPPPIQAPQAPNYQPQTPTVPGIAQQPANVTAPNVATERAGAGQFDVNAFRPFADAVYSEATRQLDPAFQQRERDLRQRMVNQGIQEGTEAFDNAFANFSRERNDAFASARNQALAQALGAQNQFFGQSATNAQMANQMGQFNAAQGLQAAGMNMQERNALAGLALQAQGMGMQDRQFGANLGLNFSQLGQQAQMANASNWLQARGLGEGARQFNANLGQRESEFGRSFGEGQRQFDASLGFQGQRADMQDLMALLGYGQQATAFNNAQLAQDQQRAMALFGLIPGLTPTQLDVMGPANGFMNAQAANANAAASRSNGIFGALGQLGAAFISDIRAKTDIQRVGVLDNGLPVYLYRYKSGGPFHIGVMAQEVEQTKPEAVREHEGIKYVDYAEAVK